MPCSEDLNRENLSGNSAIIITSLGKLSFNDAKSFKNRLKILDIYLDGIVLINKT